MAENIRVLKAEPDGDYGIIVTFSDGTEDVFTIEELLAPHRLEIRQPVEVKRVWVFGRQSANCPQAIETSATWSRL
jgi:hypothetical protein